MPWQPQICKYCDLKCANMFTLERHLQKYTRPEYRFPPDGKHDVLEIQESFRQDGPKQKCPYCKDVFASDLDLGNHIDSVIERRQETFWHQDAGDGIHTRKDWQDIIRRRPRGKWVHPFQPTDTQVYEPSGELPFLKLPAELRDEIYRYLLCPGQITLNRMNGVKVKRVRKLESGQWPQFHPLRNRLALLLTCRQIHEEASAAFFSHNRFNISVPSRWAMSSPSDTPLVSFLIGIGRQNCLLLRHIETGFHQPSNGDQNLASAIHSHVGTSEKSPWNDEEHYDRLLLALGIWPSSFSPIKRLTRFTTVASADSQSGPEELRERHSMSFDMHYAQGATRLYGAKSRMARGILTFELANKKPTT